MPSKVCAIRSTETCFHVAKSATTFRLLLVLSDTATCLALDRPGAAACCCPDALRSAALDNICSTLLPPNIDSCLCVASMPPSCETHAPFTKTSLSSAANALTCETCYLLSANCTTAGLLHEQARPFQSKFMSAICSNTVSRKMHTQQNTQITQHEPLT